MSEPLLISTTARSGSSISSIQLPCDGEIVEGPMDFGCYKPNGMSDLRFENIFDMRLRFNEGVDHTAHLDASNVGPVILLR